jgi:murein DD-endopeptidase MepM/ murein hydrolase activator NlpD
VSRYVTFNALLLPHTSLHLCKLIPHIPAAAASSAKVAVKKKAIRTALASVSIASDIQDYVPPVLESSLIPFDLAVFPLHGDGGPWLCTQSDGGSLTHFAHPSTYYAVDLRCPVGTQIVAVCDGEVVDMRSDSTCTGTHVDNLFHWNSVQLRSDEGVYVEYVHISGDGLMVKLHDRVVAGQPICRSGEAGFCPEPHLHLEIHRSGDAGSPSVPITRHGMRFVAGQTYD